MVAVSWANASSPITQQTSKRILLRIGTIAYSLRATDNSLRTIGERIGVLGKLRILGVFRKL
jgi:hypothetical protein